MRGGTQVVVGEELAGTEEASSGAGVTTTLEDILGDAARHASVLRRQSTMSRPTTHLDVRVPPVNTATRPRYDGNGFITISVYCVEPF